MADCTKRVHRTLWHALHALEAIQRRQESRGGKIPTGAYFCATCGGWHLTSKSKPRVRPRARRGPP
jgi:hypothetical protein